MAVHTIVENLFFFGLLGIVGYLMWEIIAPFIGALALAAILATISYPVYQWCIRIAPRKNESIAAVVAILIVAIIIVTPLSLIGYLLVNETVDFYETISSGTSLSIGKSVSNFEGFIQNLIPGFSVDVTSYAAQVAEWLASNFGSIFAGTASTVFLIFIAFFGLFYLFRDGKSFTKQLIYLSPLPDNEDEQILRRLATSVRSVVLGTLTVAIIQGILSAIGFTIFGIGQPALLGSIAAIGALIPGVGTTIVFLPIIFFLIISGSYGAAIGLALWAMIAVGIIDNLLGPYLIGRGATLHPFLILISVLGGMALFGPLGFILGPVVLSLFVVLLELYSTHMNPNPSK